MTISYTELYNESIFDLLGITHNKVPLELYENESGKVLVKNLNEV